MMTLLSLNKYANVEVNVNGDPYANQELHELKANYRYYMIAYGVGLGVYLITLCGASMYNSCLVSIAILYSLFNLGNMIYFGVTQGQDEEGWIFGYIVWPIVWALLYIYPHAVFISEINKGGLSVNSCSSERLFYLRCSPSLICYKRDNPAAVYETLCNLLMSETHSSLCYEFNLILRWIIN
ncbi:hypothetical protein ACHAWX_000668 [Stephanocyclus meneghinianus]